MEKENNQSEDLSSLDDDVNLIKVKNKLDIVDMIDNNITHTGTIEIVRLDREKHVFKTKVYLFVKRCFDIVFSFLLLVILSPLMILLTILDSIFNKGTPFYGHRRLGLRGKVIKVWKFRSMKKDDRSLEEVLTPEQLMQYKTEFKIEDDPRITKFGKFIRKTSLDELPQLFNVLFGSMSFVGPRPIVYREIALYYKKNARTLLGVKPGITGYWQAYGRNKITYASGERQKMEIYYCEHRSLIMDLKILFRTVISVLKKDGAE